MKAVGPSTEIAMEIESYCQGHCSISRGGTKITGKPQLAWLGYFKGVVGSLKMQGSLNGNCRPKKHITDLWDLHKLLMAGRNWPAALIST
jgi:hypothetical protein